MYRILIVEDDPTIARLLATGLCKWGYDAFPCRDLSDVEWIRRYFGLESHESSLFDLIINTAKYTPADAADLVLAALEKLPTKAKAK